MVKARVTSKGQVTIPKEVRDRLHLRQGTRLDFHIEEDGSVRLVPLSRDVDAVYGILHRPGGKALAVEEMDRAVAERMRSEYEKKRR